MVLLFDYVDIAIGFDSTSYTVNESEGAVSIRVKVDLQDSVISEDILTQVVLATVMGTATPNTGK